MTSHVFPFNDNKLEDLPLSTYLNSCPKIFGYRLRENAQKEILKRLFLELWGSNEEYRSLFFPNGFGEGPNAYKLSFAQREGEAEYSQLQKGKVCGHIFRKGEGIYHCRNCALDETCVLCSHCFRGTNHEGHDVSFSVNKDGFGCCDCGDPEAWKRPILCAYHSSEFEETRNEDVLPPDLLDSIHNTISTILDFMLDTLSASPEEMSPLNETEIKEEAKRAALHIRDPVENADEEKLFAVVLWNDEQHSFQEVIEQLRNATGCSKAEAKATTERVDSHGRDIVRISEDIQYLLSIARTISLIGLTVTVRSARDTFREGMCGLFIDWLKDLAGGKVGSNTTVLGNIICEELCKECNPRNVKRTEKRKILNEFFIKDTQDDETENMDDDEVMVMSDDDKDIIVEDYTSNNYKRPKKFIGDYDVLMEANSSDTIKNEPIIYHGTTSLMQIAEDFKKELRLDKLLILDLRFWKEARIRLAELYIRTLVINPEYKKIMGKRFARNYANFAKALISDREPDHSIMLFSVQLFPVPTISTILSTNYEFLSTIFKIHHSLFTTNTIGDDLDNIDPNAKIDCDSEVFKNRHYFHVFQDLHYIISNHAVKKVVSDNPLYLQQFLNLITLFHGMNPNVRATQQHVEYENDSWVNAFNVTLQIAESCRQFSECYTSNTETLCMTIRKVLRKLCERCYKFSAWRKSIPGSYDRFEKNSSNLSIREPDFHDVNFLQNQSLLSFQVVKFEVASQPVSFHYPLHWFLAELLENVNLLDDELLRQNGFYSFQSMIMGFDIESNEELNDVAQSFKEKILAIFDYPLRVLVLLIQIRAGFWVRNGYSIRSQCHHYCDISLRENTFDEDIFLLQTAFVVLDPNTVLATILDRFDLVDWFNGKTSHKIYNDSQLILVVEELLTLLITCVSERSSAAGLTIEQEIKREIIHGLCLGRIAYSELAKRIPERLTQDPMFDEILAKLADYRAPDSLTDHGVYELCDEYFYEVDPYFIHYSRNNKEEAEEVLKNRFKKMEETQSTTLLIPKLLPITSGPYTKLDNILHARLLNRIIYYTLFHVKNEEKIKSDTLVEGALHLIMLSLLNEKNDDADTSISSDIDEGISSFIYYSVSDFFQEMEVNQMKSQGTCLLDLLLQISCEQSFKEFYHKLEFILNKFKQFGNDDIKLKIDKHREKLRTNSHSKEAEGIKLLERERKRQAAQERKKKIMEQFAKAQQSFIEKHEQEYEGMEKEWEYPAGETQSRTDSSRPTETDWSYPTGTCIVCQEKTNASSLYGILGLIQPSSLLRRTPFDDKDYVFEIVDLPESLDFKCDRSVPYGVASSIYTDNVLSSSAESSHISKGFPSKSCRQGLYISTCGHLMHVKCFDTYVEQRHQLLHLTRNHPEDIRRKEFTCPLCKSLGNILLPIMWKVKKEISPSILKTKEEYYTWLSDKVSPSLEKLKASTLVSSSGSNLSISHTDLNCYTPFNMRELATDDKDDPFTDVSDDFHTLPVQGLSTRDISTVSNDDQEKILRMYNRLAEVVQMTYRNITPEITFQTKSLKFIEYMWDLFGYTISCVEIGQRGIGKTTCDGLVGSTLVEEINLQILTLLRILSETLLTYINKMLDNQTSELGLKQIIIHRTQQIFYGHPSFQIGKNIQNIGSKPFADDTRKMIGLFGPSIQFTKVKPLLLEDPFFVLVEICICTASVAEHEIYHMMRLLYTAEIVKVIISLVESAINNKPKAWNDDERIKKKFNELNDSSEPSIRDFVVWVAQKVGNNEYYIAEFLDGIDELTLIKLIKAFCLPYMRKCVILLHARFGVVFPKEADTDETEFVRLSKLLGFPPLERICSMSFTSSNDMTMLFTISGWCNHLYLLRQTPPPTSPSEIPNDITIIHDLLVSNGLTSDSTQNSQEQDRLYQKIDIKVNHPAIFELVGLPKRLDSLFEESLKKVCKKFKAVLHDPALCLLCGTFVCSQSYCCPESNRGVNVRGECSLHTKSCGGDIGIYLLVEKCVILLLHFDNGCFMNAPYLDAHGEVDLGLKRGRLQFLNQKRYDEIRKLWLTHSVPTRVALKYT